MDMDKAATRSASHRADRGAGMIADQGACQRRQYRQEPARRSRTKVKGVILRINSPGGSPVQSGYVYDEIRRLRA
jgi:protease-4